MIGGLRTTTRGLLRNPGFTAVTVLTLALGLGGSAAIYTLLDRVVLDPLPYADAGRLVQLTNRVPGVSADAVWNMSTAQYLYLLEHSAELESVGLYRQFGANIESPDGPQRALGSRVTASIFPLLGVTAAHGRVITTADAAPGGPDVVVLSDGFWRRQFGEDSGVIGRGLTIDGNQYEMIGVLDAAARLPGDVPGTQSDFWIPQRVDPEGRFSNNHVYPMVGRLRPGADPATAEAELERLTSQLPDRFPQAYSQQFFDQYGFRTVVTPLKDAILGNMAQNIWILFAAVGLVLAIAAANAANLFLVRMDGRRRELAMRTALGAGRAQIARHILTESCVLSFAGGALALLIGWWGVPALGSLAPASIPRLDGLALDVGTITFTAVLSLIVAMGIAAYPLIHVLRHADPGRLGATERSGTGDREQQRLRAGLVMAQVALALTLITGAGLLIESMRRLSQIEPGFQPEGLLTAGLFVTPTGYNSDTELWTAYRQILEAVRAVPGVQAAGISEELPVLGSFGCTVQAFEDEQIYERLRGAGMTTCAGQEPTSPGYFEAAGIPLLDGRLFVDADNDDPSRGAVIVSRAFAGRFWPGEDPIGKGIAPSGRTNGPFYHVVGVVGDVPASSLDGETAIAVYYPMVHQETETSWGQWYPFAMSLVVRTNLADPLSLASAVRAAVLSVDPTIPVAHVASMEQIVQTSIARFRFTSLLLGIAAGVALLLAAVGLYGVVSYVVGRRTREIGIRIAIGALPSAVGREVVRRSLVLVAGGLALGLILASLTTRALRGFLFGVEPNHPVTFVMAAATLVMVAGIAAWFPARRASRIDPVNALRAE